MQNIKAAVEAAGFNWQDFFDTCKDEILEVMVGGDATSLLAKAGATFPALNITAAAASDVQVAERGFSPEVHYRQSLALSTTTTTASRKLNETINTSAGTYKFEFSFGWSVDITSSSYVVSILIDGANVSTAPYFLRQEIPESGGTWLATGSNQHLRDSGFFIKDLTAGNHTVAVDFGCDRAGTTSAMWDLVVVATKI